MSEVFITFIPIVHTDISLKLHTAFIIFFSIRQRNIIAKYPHIHNL